MSAFALGLPAPAVEGDVVVAGFASGEVAALRATDGRLVWSEALGVSRGSSLADITGVSGMPVIDRGRVFVTAQGSATVCLDLRSGRRLWERDVASAETPWIAGDWLFLRTNLMEIACLSRNDGRVRWVQGLPRYQDERRRRDPIVWSGPVVAGGRLLLSSTTAELLELNVADGEPLARSKLSAGSLLQPMIFGGTLYLLDEAGDVVALRG